MPSGDERAYHEAVRAFDLAAADLANPVPRLMADLTAPEERLRELQREPPLVYFSPFDALPEDMAHDGRERGYAGATPNPGGTEKPSRRTSANALDRHRLEEGSVDAVEARGHLDVPAKAPEEQESRANPAYQELSTLERPETDLLTDPMFLLGTLAEDAMATRTEAQARTMSPHPAITPPRTARSRPPDRETRGSETAAPVYPPALHPAEDRSIEGLPGFVAERLDTPAAAHPEDAMGFRRSVSDGGGLDAPIDPLGDDVFSPPTPGSEVYVPEVGDLSGEAQVPGHSAFGALYGAFDEPDGRPPVGGEVPEGRMPEKSVGQHLDAEAFADLVNEVLVRQARRHGVDLS